jgi:hypothetical protein
MQKVERLKRSLHFIGAPAQNSHTVFLDEEEAASFRPDEHFDTPAELLDRTFNRPHRAQISDAKALSGLGQNPQKLERYINRPPACLLLRIFFSLIRLSLKCMLCRMQTRAYKQLLQREERKGNLGAVLSRMELEKAVMVQV